MNAILKKTKKLAAITILIIASMTLTAAKIDIGKTLQYADRLMTLYDIIDGVGKILNSANSDEDIEIIKRADRCVETKKYKEALDLYFSIYVKSSSPKVRAVISYKIAEVYYLQEDYAEAAKWFSKAAVQGNAKAQSMLGTMYSNGQGVPQDYAKAKKWYRKAAVQGLAEAQSELGFMYMVGRGVQKDYAEAAKWYRKAADQGDKDAIEVLKQFR